MSRLVIRVCAIALAAATLTWAAAVPVRASTLGSFAAATLEQPKPAELIDINAADKATLMTLVGIGEAYSDKIIKNRPYRAKNELVSKGIIPQATYDKIADKIIAKQKK